MRFWAIVAFLPVAAFGVTIETLPISDYADMEMSTNIPFEVSFDAMSRMNFSISLEASPSNCVEVSIGEDANADGNLSPEEAVYTFGFDCGRWYVRDADRDEERGTGEEAGERRVEKTFLLKKRRMDEAWDLVKVTRRGKAEVCELATVEGAKPGAALIVR